MKQVYIGIIGSLALIGSAVGEESIAANKAEAQALMKEFAETLSGTLQAAVKEGGLARGIEVCKSEAPGIADELSERSGWEIGRTSLRMRNPELNAPDEWEEDVLASFERRKAGGEEVATIAHAEIVETADGRQFRFMKAIPTGEVCLKCHGIEIDPEVAEAINNAYPDDAARGFKLGDIRGAFTLSKDL